MPRPETVGRSGGSGGLVRGLLLLVGLVAVRPILRRLFGARHRSPRPPRAPRVDSLAVAAGHETRDAPIAPILAGAIVLVVGLGLTVLTATWLSTAWIGHPISWSQSSETAAPPPPPEPRLEEVPGAQLRQVRAAEDAFLTSTGWVDRQAGLAHIPIDRAIDLMAANPPPARAAEDGGQYPSDDARPSAASSGRGPAGRAP